MKQHLVNPHAVLIYAVALIVAGYQAAYPYLNPNNLQWQNAVVYGALAIISALVYGNHVVSTQIKMAHIVDALPATQSSDPPTGHMPTVRAPLADSPDNYLK